MPTGRSLNQKSNQSIVDTFHSPQRLAEAFIISFQQLVPCFPMHYVVQIFVWAPYGVFYFSNFKCHVFQQLLNEI